MADEPVMAYMNKFSHLVRCDKCHKPTHNAYVVKDLGDGQTYKFHSSWCYREALKNYREKGEMGVKNILDSTNPSVSVPKVKIEGNLEDE